MRAVLLDLDRCGLNDLRTREFLVRPMDDLLETRLNLARDVDRHQAVTSVAAADGLAFAECGVTTGLGTWQSRLEEPQHPASPGLGVGL